jgi:hypothetical protein
MPSAFSSAIVRLLLAGAAATCVDACSGGDDGVNNAGAAGSQAMQPGRAGGGSAGDSPGASGGSVGEAGDNGASGGGNAAGAGPGGDAQASDAATVADAIAAVDAGPIQHHLMVVEYPGRIVEISAEGKVMWEHMTPSLTVMFNVLPSGNVFFPHGAPSPGAQEVDKNHSVVWTYTSKASELLGGERLANGNSLLGEGGPGTALELDPGKQVARSIAIPTSETDAHRIVRHLHRLPNGNVLAALEGEGAAREFDAAGKTVWEYKGVTHIHEAIRLPNGNTLIGGGESKMVLEVTPGGQIAWQFGEQDGPTLGLAWIASVQVLKNGDLLVCNWVGGDGGPGVHAFQVTRDKKVVWKLDDHQTIKSATTVTALDD